MPNTKNNHLLIINIQKLPFSSGLKTVLTAAGIKILLQLLDVPYYKWEATVPNLTGRQRCEIIYFVLEHGLEEFILLK